MATRPQETPAFPTIYEYYHDYYEEAAAATAITTTGCHCLRRFCLGLDAEEESISYLLHEKEASLAPLIKDTWLLAKLRKLREFSELVAGHKWKNFVRKIGKICTCKKSTTTVQFQYSPESYALNFGGGDREDDGDLLHSFSTRFAPGFSVNDQRKRAAM